MQPDDEVVASSPYPGLVRVEDASNRLSEEFCDPVYALQAMPNCVVVEAGMCKGQANPIMNSRCIKIEKMLRKIYLAARKAAVDDDGNEMIPKASIGFCK